MGSSDMINASASNTPAANGTCTDPDPNTEGDTDYVCPRGFMAKDPAEPNGVCTDLATCNLNCCEASRDAPSPSGDSDSGSGDDADTPAPTASPAPRSTTRTTTSNMGDSAAARADKTVISANVVISDSTAFDLATY